MYVKYVLSSVAVVTLSLHQSGYLNLKVARHHNMHLLPYTLGLSYTRHTNGNSPMLYIYMLVNHTSHEFTKVCITL